MKVLTQFCYSAIDTMQYAYKNNVISNDGLGGYSVGQSV